MLSSDLEAIRYLFATLLSESCYHKDMNDPRHIICDAELSNPGCHVYAALIMNIVIDNRHIENSHLDILRAVCFSDDSTFCGCMDCDLLKV